MVTISVPRDPNVISLPPNGQPTPLPVTTNASRIYLSAPHMSGLEQEFIAEAFATNWIAPIGPHVTAFEEEFADLVGSPYAAALSSGTAALHLALLLADVGIGDDVLVSTFTFSASANPIVYLGGRPIFVDSELSSWNMDPHLLTETLAAKARKGKLPKAVVVVHLYGQSADLNPIIASCNHYGIPLIEDAAEALGSSYQGRAPGTFGKTGIYSFNGNKIITTSGGGMLVSHDIHLINQAKKLATQARDNAPHYQHSQIGYNYRLSNILAGIGRGQLRVLEERVQGRRRNFDYYQQALASLPGIAFMPEATWGRHTRWLTCITVNPAEFGATREEIRATLEAQNIEARPVWKPMHLQPIFKDCPVIGGGVAETLFEQGLCLPSGTNLTEVDLRRVVDAIYALFYR
ncbi:MAG: DegT/DnrJ/EryC1/StrS family aminotransferase [Caldilineaceae bacterium]|nr:DegT/DnrJ/EryC1/StrS family aminotransferase [Caldilineaceae bacterium]